LLFGYKMKSPLQRIAIIRIDPKQIVGVKVTNSGSPRHEVHT
jgi:hypothetical protein